MLMEEQMTVADIAILFWFQVFENLRVRTIAELDAKWNIVSWKFSAAHML